MWPWHLGSFPVGTWNKCQESWEVVLKVLHRAAFGSLVSTSSVLSPVCLFMLWSITHSFNLCPHAATLLIKGPTQPVLEGQAVTLECRYSDSEFNISQVRFEVFSKVSPGNKRVCDNRGNSLIIVLFSFRLHIGSQKGQSVWRLFEFFYTRILCDLITPVHFLKCPMLTGCF